MEHPRLIKTATFFKQLRPFQYWVNMGLTTASRNTDAAADPGAARPVRRAWAVFRGPSSS